MMYRDGAAMTTFNYRQRMLSIDRRAGFQGSREAGAGVAQRQREDARDDIEDSAQSEAVSLAIEAVATFALLAATAFAVWVAVAVLA